MTERDRKTNTSIDAFISDQLRDIGRRSVRPGPIDRILLAGDTSVYTKLATNLGMTQEQIDTAVQEGEQSAQTSS